MSKLSRRLDIQRIRAEKKITQKELSSMTGYPQSFISKMERGRVSTPEPFIEKVRDVLQIADIENYIAYIKPSTSDIPEDLPEERQPRNSDIGMSDKQMIQRLFDLLEKRDARIDKLERENDQLRRELALQRQLQTPQKG